MIDISVRGLVKSFEVGKNILDALSFEVNQGERVGILGKNGCGKTTLLKILADELDFDEGSVVKAGGKRLGLISQIPEYPEHFTTEDVLKSAHKRLFSLADRIKALEAAMELDDSPEVLREYDTLAAEFQRLGGYDMDFERNRVANGLEISETMRAQAFSSLSGGEKTRVNLARLILEDTDILLLDEPTNHLDLKATEWLEEYLLKFKGTVLVVSHDRYFLDRVVTRVFEIAGGKAEFYSGNYSFYLSEKQRRFDEQKKRYEREQKELKRLDEAARRLYQWGTGNEKLMKKSQAIRSRMERMEKTDRPISERKLSTRFGERDFFGDEVLLIRGAGKSYGETALFEGLDLLVEGGERIALIGDNGAGKSTLIKLITGEEQPDTGSIRLGPSVKLAYLPQIVSFPHPERSALDTMIYGENCTAQTARNRLGAFKFSGEDVFKPVSALSGGEKSRLRLCMLMREEINFLILDEPTNHLDITSREWIEEAVEDFDGALLFVSHDRYFIDRFASRIWELSGGELWDFRGGFAEFRRFKEKNAAVQNVVVKKDAKKRDDKKKTPFGAEKARLRVEREIVRLEQQIAELDREAEEFSSDYERLLDIGLRREAADDELTALYGEWEELSS